MWTALLVVTLGVLAAGGWYHLLPRSAEASAPAIYSERCSQCHGAAGRGDGSVGMSLEPRPRDFADAEWQASISDARIAQSIREGGAAVGLSPAMPSQPDLSDRQLRKLVAYIREVGARPAAVDGDRTSTSGR